MVRVTEDPAAVSGSIQAPPQRLATSHTSLCFSWLLSTDEITLAIATLTLPTPPVDAPADPPMLNRGPLKPESDHEAFNRGQIENAVAMLEKQSTLETELVSAIEADEKSPATASPKTQATLTAVTPETDTTQTPPSQPESVGGLVSASLTDLAEPNAVSEPPAMTHTPELKDLSAVAEPDVDDAMDSGQSPSVSRKPIPRTSQPHSIDDVLAQTLTDLPSLPEREANPNDAAPIRIGETAGGDASEIRTVSHTKIETDPNVAVGSLETFSDADLFEELLLRLAAPAEKEGSSDQLRREFLVRHLMVLAGDPENAVRSMDALGEHEQRYLTNQLKALWQMIDPEGHPSSTRRLTSTLPFIREATSNLSAATDSLELRNLVFCTEIESYGKFKPFEGNRFVAGQQVIVYCEVENFISAATDDGFFQTELQGIYDLYDASGNKVLSQLLPLDSQTIRNPLRDHFVAYQMGLSAELVAGSYRLELTLEDRLGKKYGQASVPFEIVGSRR
ncbi:MAG: hypothetical protein AAGJ83_02120 [Planctomycetota bacterium]